MGYFIMHASLILILSFLGPLHVARVPCVGAPFVRFLLSTHRCCDPQVCRHRNVTSGLKNRLREFCAEGSFTLGEEVQCRDDYKVFANWKRGVVAGTNPIKV